MAVDLKQFDDEFDSEVIVGKAENLSDGDYEWKVTRSALKTPGDKVLIDLDLMVMNQGKHEGEVIGHQIWFPKDQDANRATKIGQIKKLIAAMGFDVTEWKQANNRPFSEELPKAVRLMVGLRMKGKKATNSSGEGADKKTYHNLYLNERVKTDGYPAKFGPDELNAPDPEDPFG